MKDLHTKKASHMSVPITKGIEFHFEKKDLGKMKLKVGKKYHAVIPMKATSKDAGHGRMKQSGKVEVHAPEMHLKDVTKRMFNAKSKGE